jgi:hypothetical protein
MQQAVRAQLLGKPCGILVRNFENQQLHRRQIRASDAIRS